MKNDTHLLSSLACAASWTLARFSPAQGLQHGESLYEQHQYAEAMPLLRQAAKSGNAQAQSTLGIMYRKRQGVRADDHSAAHWFRLAVAQGERVAQYQLGVMYERGKGGLPKDDCSNRVVHAKQPAGHRAGTIDAGRRL